MFGLPVFNLKKFMQNEPIAIISKDFPKLVIPLIDSAHSSIDIIIYDWRFYKHDPASSVSMFNSAIIRAVKRGVIVRCIVHNPAVLDILKSFGCQARILYSKKILHTKLTIIDNQSIIIGSHNYTQHAFNTNHECSVFFKMSLEENEFVKYFNNLFGL
jgi:phosphatidylserine/phosphatidylglycerophosphate/cardiolipin synthase-like enzyme